MDDVVKIFDTQSLLMTIILNADGIECSAMYYRPMRIANSVLYDAPWSLSNEMAYTGSILRLATQTGLSRSEWSKAYIAISLDCKTGLEHKY